ncbi:MAG: B12-binding domain-containing radical SAM protein [Deltaproteobacteria bacterium]|nr:B12-binding domain-containing radical SAM protein [Deltaproteobacteria bacterium]
MKKILFISAINPLSEVEGRYPDLGLAYLAGALRKAFGRDAFEIRIINGNVTKELLEFKPDVVGIRSVSQNYNIAKKYAVEAKAMGISVMAGGVHISALPHTLSKDMDVGCVGEGEVTIVELMEFFSKEGSFDNKDALSRIKGIVYHDGEEIRRTPDREPIADPDSIPMAAKDLLKIGHHSYLFTSRGCPYRCVFCASSVYWDKLRFFSAERVVEEIRELVDVYGVKLVSFYDDLFVANTKRLNEIAALLKKTDIPGRVKFTCSSSATKITKEVVAALKEMNIVSVGMGLESGCERTLKYLKGNAFSVEKNRESVRLLSEGGIAANASFVIAAPDETADEIMETYAFIRDNPLSLVDVYVITPFPGTPLWDIARKKGLVSDDMDWDRLNINFEVNYKDAIIVSERLSRDEIQLIYRKFRRQRLVRNLKNIWRHPYIMDVPRVAVKTAIERVARLFA